ncbi:MAG: NnrU family protein [Woeseiaceae bacterium]|nr:NnrU family protein [Woeseiaceae bacterium]
MKRWTVLVYGVTAYLLSAATLIYSMLFLGNLFVSRTIDAAAGVPLGDPLLVNSGLLLAFALQHGGMARASFKAWLSRVLSPDIVRSTYVMLSCIALTLLMVLWQPIGGIVWRVDGPLAKQVIMTVYFFGWVLMIWATFLLDHFELFGIKQVWCRFRGLPACDEPAFQTPSAYQIVRHPIYAGWVVVLWASPIMTVAHFVLAIGLTAYVVYGIRLEERDLQERLPYYEQYRRKVPMLVPSWKKRLANPGED